MNDHADLPRGAARPARAAGWAILVVGVLLVLGGFAAAFTTVGAVLIYVGAPLVLVGLGLLAGGSGRFLVFLVLLVLALVVALFVMAGVSELVEKL